MLLVPPCLHATSPEKQQTGWHFDFSALPSAAREALKAQGFEYRKAMQDEKAIALTGDGSRLNISARKPVFGLMLKKGLHIDGANTVEIEWGIEHYPETANWSDGSNREAVMVYLFFGEPVAADRFYLPKSPHFIGLFLGQNDELDTPFVGGSYTATGRYVCLANPEPGATVTSTFNFGEAFQSFFNKTEVPPITGIAIEVDTGGLPSGHSVAFIRHIRLTAKDESS